MYMSRAEAEWDSVDDTYPFLIEHNLIRFRDKNGRLTWGFTPLPQSVAHAHIVRGKDLREGPIQAVQAYYNLPKWNDPGLW